MSTDKKQAEPPHIASLRRQDKLNRLSAAVRFRVAGGRVEKYKGQHAPQDIEAAAKAAVAQERYMNPQIGHIDGRGIFLGIWEPKDGNGNSLKKKFNVFAAPENLRHGFTYDQAVSHISGLRGWHGHDGADYANDTALYEALQKDAYDGGWFMPPVELVLGKDADGNDVMPDNLVAHQCKGAFNNTFGMAGWDGDPEFYWTSTEHDSHGFKTRVVRLDNGTAFYFLKDDNYFSCRPVRLEPRP